MLVETGSPKEHWPCLAHQSRQPGQHVIHYFWRNAFYPLSLTILDIQGAYLAAQHDAGGGRARIGQRYGEASRTREAATIGNRRDEWRTHCQVERVRRHDQHRACFLWCMISSGIERDEVDVTSLYYRRSRPTRSLTSHSRSSAETPAVVSHWASSSSRE